MHYCRAPPPLCLPSSEELDQEADESSKGDSILREKKKARSLSKNYEKEVAEASEMAEREPLDDDANRVPVSSENDDEHNVVASAGEKDDVKETKLLGFNRFMIGPVWKHGRGRLAKDNIRKARIDAHLCKERKMRINRDVGNPMSKRKAAVNSVSKNEKIGEQPPWTKLVMERFPQFY